MEEAYIKDTAIGTPPKEATAMPVLHPTLHLNNYLPWHSWNNWLRILFTSHVADLLKAY